MNSLWRGTSPLIEVDAAVPPHADVVVAGAGLAGLSTAALLSRAGLRVAVLEARDVGSVATGNTTAKLSLLQGSVYSGLLSHAGLDALEAYVDANRAAQEWVRAELDGDAEALEARDAFTYATTADGARAVDDEAQALAAVAVDVDVLAAGQDAGLPYETTRAIRMRDQWQIHPMRLLARLAASVRDHGGVIVTDCRVHGVEVEDASVVVRTSHGELDADRLVVATGSPAIDRAGFFARLAPSRSLVGAYRVPGAVPRGMYVSLDPDGRSLRTARSADGAELLLVGGSAFTPGRERETDRLLRELDDWTASAFPGAERTTWWAAQDYRTVSRVPFAGVMPGTADRVLAATGFNKWGMTNAVAAGLAIAGDLTGARVPWADALRSPHLNVRDAAEFVSAQAAVAGSAVSGIVRHGPRPVAEADGCRVSGVCTHLGGALEWNPLERSWDCPLHGSRFAPDGAVLEGPAVEPLKPVG